MEKDNGDRRVQRTRQLLQQALIALILDKSYEKVTVQDIIDRANVSRSTFYAHYRDKEDLLLRGVAGITYGDELQELMNEAVEQFVCADDPATISTIGMFRHVKQNNLLQHEMYKLSKDNALLEKGTAFLRANVQAQLKRFTDAEQETSMPVSALAEFLTGGLMALTRWWVDNDMPYSPQEMDELVQQMVVPGVRNMLDQKLLSDDIS